MEFIPQPLSASPRTAAERSARSLLRFTGFVIQPPHPYEIAVTGRELVGSDGGGTRLRPRGFSTHGLSLVALRVNALHDVDPDRFYSSRRGARSDHTRIF